jgi:hypothetical protein
MNNESLELFLLVLRLLAAQILTLGATLQVWSPLWAAQILKKPPELEGD